MATMTAKKSCCGGGKTPCDCPKCTGLECLERPRFFAGQLLTETELTSELDYLRAKHRLHNLHHHGWGVVCGLEVACHECAGWVTVQPGYAIDPCGEDVIVCQEHPLNVAEMIRRCKEARRRRRRADCEPIRGADDPKCRQQEEHWCITLSYAEREARPTTALRRQACDRCGCGPGCRCGCPCHGEETAGHDHCCDGERPARVRSGVGKTVSPCEPTRILETYCLDVCEAPKDYCENVLTEAEKLWAGKLGECTEHLKDAAAGIPQRVSDVLLLVISDQQQELPSADEMYQACCFFKEHLRSWFRRNPSKLQCSFMDRLNSVSCPPPGVNEIPQDYVLRVRDPVRRALGFFFQYLYDCVCYAFLPPCAPCCPGEDLLIIACLTVRDGKIRHICNYSCRRYAGVFPPSLAGGLYVGPLLGPITKILADLCCGETYTKLFEALKPVAGATRIDQLVQVPGPDDLFAAAAKVSPQASGLASKAEVLTHAAELESLKQEVRLLRTELTALRLASAPQDGKSNH